LLRLCLIVGLAWCFHLLLGWSRTQLETGSNGLAAMMPALFMGLLLLYALLIALPFVPGIEIGLALMMAEGPQAAPWVYLATLLGLALAFAAGASLPYALLRNWLVDLRLVRICRLLDRLEPLDRDARLALLVDHAPNWLGPLTRFRHLVLALLVNLPGNALLGGGGGILFLAGFSRLFSTLPTIATLAVAVAPVPLLVWSFGIDPTAWLR
jgi:hypothetical protein